MVGDNIYGYRSAKHDGKEEVTTEKQTVSVLKWKIDSKEKELTSSRVWLQ